MTRRNKTKEELKAIREQRKAVIKLKSLAEKALLPILIANDLTAYQSGQTLDILKSVIMGKMNDHWTDKKMSDLDLIGELTKDTKAKDRDLYQSLLKEMDDLPINEVTKLLESFERVLQMYSQRHVMQIKVKELPIDEIFGV